MIMKTIVSHLCALAIFAFASIQSGLVAQEKSVNPGINKSFQKPEVSNFVERFEKEGREVYDNREEIINACQLRPAMVVADVGAGTGLFTRLLSPKVSKVIAVDIAQEFLELMAPPTQPVLPRPWQFRSLWQHGQRKSSIHDHDSAYPHHQFLTPVTQLQSD